MIKNLLSLCLVLFTTTIFASDFTAELKTENPSPKINDGSAYVLTNGGVAPFTYKWSKQSVELGSSSCNGLTEGRPFSVLVKDAEGNEVFLESKIATTSVEEGMNSAFKPIVDNMADFLFKDIFTLIGIYDPTVYKVESELGYSAWTNPSAKEVRLINWSVDNNSQVEEGQFLGTIMVNENSKEELIANGTGELIQTVKSGEVLVGGSLDKPIKQLGRIQFSEPEAMLHPNGDTQEKTIPFIVVWLVLGAIFFTIRMKFINLRGVKHAIQLIQGKYDNPEGSAGEVSHFQALTTALSGTVGLGNIAGVAVAISLGGPGATFWMIVAGLIGMASKFVECTLGVKYRRINENGEVSGGPMYYLSEGLKRKNMKVLGKVLAFVFAILCIGASFGGGNMFQANQAFAQLSSEFTSLQGGGVWFGIVLALLVGVVIIGGIKSIAKVTDKIVPFMAGLYVLFSLIIIGINFANIGDVFVQIFDGAFNSPAIKGGVIGVLIVGFQRAAFSNEAGVGSASIAHSASKTEEPVSEGIVALLEPFIDTVVVCTMTALVLVFTGFADGTSSLQGSELTSAAFGSVFPWFSLVLVVAIFLFAFSTMISWSYYGLKAWTYLLGNSKAAVYSYKIIFCVFIVIGSSVGLGAVLDFSDLMILGMAFPNILGLVLLSKEVREDMVDYFARVKSGAIKKFK